MREAVSDPACFFGLFVIRDKSREAVWPTETNIPAGWRTSEPGHKQARRRAVCSGGNVSHSLNDRTRNRDVIDQHHQNHQNQELF